VRFVQQRRGSAEPRSSLVASASPLVEVRLDLLDDGRNTEMLAPARRNRRRHRSVGLDEAPSRSVDGVDEFNRRRCGKPIALSVNDMVNRPRGRKGTPLVVGHLRVLGRDPARVTKRSPQSSESAEDSPPVAVWWTRGESEWRRGAMIAVDANRTYRVGRCSGMPTPALASTSGWVDLRRHEKNP